jgi:predicted metal-dependent phosphotriesterase family hydrolase
VATVQTARGPLEAAALGRVLMHEHVFVLGTEIADFKVPQYLTVWDGPLPRNPGGKILKAHLRQQVEWGEPLR